ncbi:hypothetical protein GCM10017771_18410 [Streptomyces capitiformicae]|uniref:Uncharacterized protein n=1 Tax=Streptomyces capitiformicae TaxID=2014920 RepID=A0A919GIJ8_9ACTN|nr:hypothetical protein [Streptomyces capitiformicae]GHH85460.1 hypothetical protein GCM10017771_18410 [Streptomyces capitiformicae]
MRIAFADKGCSGWTTLSVLFSRHLARSGAPFLAIDGDINQHLADALDLDEDEFFTALPLSARTGEIKDYLRGTNPRILSRDAMIETTPPIALCEQSLFVRAQEQGRDAGELELHNARAGPAAWGRGRPAQGLESVPAARRQFHLRNATAWAAFFSYVAFPAYLKTLGALDEEAAHPSRR